MGFEFICLGNWVMRFSE